MLIINKIFLNFKLGLQNFKSNPRKPNPSLEPTSERCHQDEDSSVTELKTPENWHKLLVTNIIVAVKSNLKNMQKFKVKTTLKP